MANELAGIVAGELEQVATGFTFTEGPVWHPAGYWLFVDVQTLNIFKLVPGGQPEVFRPDSQRSNGLTFDMSGRLVICEGDGHRLARREADGTYTSVADNYQGKALNRPNDVVCHSDGSIYFTDPQTPPAPETWGLPSSDVIRVAPDGTVDRVVTHLPFPNGLALSPDERTLYVINTSSSTVRPFKREAMAIHAFPINADGNLGEETFRIPMDASYGEGGPDGMKVDVNGRIYSTGPGGLWIIEPDGQLLGILPIPEVPSNCAWGGDDYHTLFLTARTSVYQVRMAAQGVIPPGALDLGARG
jgi:gluconolactonase